MLLATMVLLFGPPQAANVTSTVTETPAALSANSTEASSAPEQLPAMPAPKVKSDLLDAAEASAVPANAAAAQPRPMPAFEPVKPALTRPVESSRQRKMWYALTVTSHGAAAFDAYSTRRAVAQGFTEANPFLRPFANSNAIYVATQVSPAVMDYLGKRMMVSQNKWIRRMWWLPQVAGSGFSIGAGVHNMRIVQ
jgi:hypothetical protein